MLLGFIALVIILCITIISYIYYKTLEEKQSQDTIPVTTAILDKEEEEKINKARQEKLRIEKERAETQAQQEQYIAELKPLLEKFLLENDKQRWFGILQEAEDILKGGPVSLQEILQHNVLRKFKDGSIYKVGIAKPNSAGQEYSLSPEKVEALQSYFLCFLDFYSQIISKGYTIDKQLLHHLISEELTQNAKK